MCAFDQDPTTPKLGCKQPRVCAGMGCTVMHVPHLSTPSCIFPQSLPLERTSAALCMSKLHCRPVTKCVVVKPNQQGINCNLKKELHVNSGGAMSVITVHSRGFSFATSRAGDTLVRPQFTPRKLSCNLLVYVQICQHTSTHTVSSQTTLSCIS